MSKFGTIELNKETIDALKKQKISAPTKVQEDVYTDILEHKDLIVQSETGSGKTLAYLLPLFEKYKDAEKTNKVIVLVPTQELAMQVHKQIQLFAKNAGVNITSAPIFGNVNIERQKKTLKEKPLFIVGTAARITELIKMRKIAAHNVKTVVLDEADKLVDKKMIDDTKALIKCTMKDRQLLFFSASMPNFVVKEAQEMAAEAKVVKSKEKLAMPENIENWYIVVDRKERMETLRKIIHALKQEKIMIFLNGRHEIEEAIKKLQYHHFPVAAIYGGVDKMGRKQAIEQFRTGKLKYMIATDIAARGLHFNDVNVVVQMTLPEEARDYLHRAGRTGRNGKAGRNISLVTQREEKKIKGFAKELGIEVAEIKLKEGQIIKA